MTDGGSKHSRTDLRLTPEASEAIESTVNRWRESFIAIVQAAHSQGESVSSEISADEVRMVATQLGIDLQIEADAKNLRSSKRQRLRFTLTAAALASVAVAFVAFLLQSQSLERADQWASVVGLFTSVVGIIVGVYGAYFVSRRREKKVDSPVIELTEPNYLLMWSNFENALRQLAASRGLEGSYSNNRLVPLRQLLDAYSIAAELDDTEREEIFRLLQLRNRVAHGQRVDSKDLASLLPRLSYHLSKIDRLSQ